MKEFTLDEKAAMSHGFSAGNYANAYKSTDLERFDLDSVTEHYRVAFVLGFYSSYELDEIPYRMEYEAAYLSCAGQYVVKVACYCDPHDDI